MTTNRFESRDRLSDKDGGQLKWNFGRDSAGMIKRIREAQTGDALLFREDDYYRPVSPSRAARWRDIFQELCDQGVLTENRSADNRGPAYKRTGVPFSIDEAYPDLVSLEESLSLRSMIPICNFVEEDADRTWPQGFNVNFFLKDELSKEHPQGSLLTRRLNQVLLLIQQFELSKQSSLPAIQSKTCYEGHTKTSFGADLVRCFRDTGRHSSDLPKKVLLVAGDIVMDRPFLARDNQDHMVYQFQGETLKQIERFSVYAMNQLPFENIKLYRTMGYREALLWDEGNFEALTEHGVRLMQNSRDGVVSWGHREPMFHFSVMKEAWAQLHPETVVRRFIIPKATLQFWASHGEASVGAGLGPKGIEDSGSLLEIGIPMRLAKGMVHLLG